MINLQNLPSGCVCIDDCQYVTDVIERMNPKQIDMPFNRQKFDEFYSQKRLLKQI